MNEQMKYGEIWYLHTDLIEDYPVFRKDEILPSEKTRVNQENVTVRRYRYKNTANIPHMQNLKTSKPENFGYLGLQREWSAAQTM